MSAIRATNNVFADDLDLTPGSITRLASTTIIFHGCKICCTKPNALRPLITINTAGLKNSAIYLRQNDASRVIKLNRISDLNALRPRRPKDLVHKK